MGHDKISSFFLKAARDGSFMRVLDHLSGFENYTFFDFQKKIFSFHPRPAARA